MTKRIYTEEQNKDSTLILQKAIGYLNVN